MAVGVTYLRPATGATAPTQKQVQRQSTVVAVLAGTALNDTQVFVSHDFNLPASDISQGFPTVDFEPLDPSAYTAQWFEASQAPNFTMLGKTVSVGNLAGNQLKVTITRPNTLVR